MDACAEDYVEEEGVADSLGFDGSGLSAVVDSLVAAFIICGAAGE